MTQKHTPLPWELSPTKFHVCTNDTGIKGLTIATTENHGTFDAKANAAFIVRACNNFDALLHALKVADEALENASMYEGDYELRTIVGAAIANAEAL